MNRLSIIGVFLGVLFLMEGNAQSFYNFGKQRTLLVSGGIGNATYFGDLKNSGDYFDPKLNLTGGLQWFFHPSMSVRADLTYFTLSGDDKDAKSKAREARNLNFKSSNLELDFTGTYNLFELPPRFNQRPVFNAYAFIGFGVLYTNPTTELDGKKHALQPLKTEGVSYSRFQLVIPYGIGVRIKAHTFFNVVLEGGYRKTFTDYLDDVSTVYPNRSTWDPASVRYKLSDRTPELGLSAHEPGQIRGDASKDDGYFLFNVKVEYYLANNFLVKQGNQRKLYNQKRKSFYRRRR
jgi:hypothetical protein